MQHYHKPLQPPVVIPLFQPYKRINLIISLKSPTLVPFNSFSRLNGRSVIVFAISVITPHNPVAVNGRSCCPWWRQILWPEVKTSDWSEQTTHERDSIMWTSIIVYGIGYRWITVRRRGRTLKVFAVFHVRWSFAIGYCWFCKQFMVSNRVTCYWWNLFIEQFVALF
jgi:hypothetical protein